MPMYNSGYFINCCSTFRSKTFTIDRGGSSTGRNDQISTEHRKQRAILHKKPFQNMPAAISIKKLRFDTHLCKLPGT